MLLRSLCLLLALVCGPLSAAQPQERVANTSASAINLEPLRRLIDERLALMPDVARHKWNTHGAIDDLPREARLIEALSAQAQLLGVPTRWAERFFRAQIDGAKQIQRAHFLRWQQADAGKFADVPDLVTVIRPRLDALTPQLLRELAAAWPALADPSQQARIALVMGKLSNSTPEAAATVLAPLIDGSAAGTDREPPAVVLKSDVASIHSPDGTLDVSLYGIYVGRKLAPGYFLSFSEVQKCKTKKRESCAQKTYSHSYENIAELIDALERTSSAFRGGKDVVLPFKLCRLACDSTPLYSELRLAAHGGNATLNMQQTRDTSYRLRLNESSVASLISALKYANDIQDYLAPQFQAFNSTQPNRAVSVDLDLHLKGEIPKK